MSKKNSIGKIVPKKMIAFPKFDSKVDYKTFICIECKTEYLSQALIELEKCFCPNHIDCYYCNGCGEMFNDLQLKKDIKDLQFYCKECYTEYCKNCGDSIELNDKYCSNECKNEFLLYS